MKSMWKCLSEQVISSFADMNRKNALIPIIAYVKITINHKILMIILMITILVQMNPGMNSLFNKFLISHVKLIILLTRKVLLQEI